MDNNQLCEIYENVMNITNYCEVDIFGQNIQTPCIENCIESLKYAYLYCSVLYTQGQILDKIINLLELCKIQISH